MMSSRVRTFVKAAAVALVAVAAASPAFATFPGQNGNVAYGLYNGARSSSNIFLSTGGQLTQTTGIIMGTSTFLSYDSWPAWSPDGSQLAFIRTIDDVSSISVIGKDGTGLRQVLSVTSLPLGNVFGTTFHLSSLAWSPDGQRITFFDNASDFLFAQSVPTTGIWSVNLDGSGLVQIVDARGSLLSSLIHFYEYNADVRLEWSVSNKLAFACNFRATGSTPTVDLCVLDGNSGGMPQPLQINLPDGTQGTTVFDYFPSVSWSPDGAKILFTAGQNVNRQIFTINADGTALTQLTNLGGDSCPINYDDARYSPDAQWILGGVTYYQPEQFSFGVACVRSSSEAIAVLSLKSGMPSATPSIIASSPSLLLDNSGEELSGLDWQPIPQALTINFDDGHGDPLKGMKVELYRNDGTLQDSHPINSAGGTYVFPNGASYAGDFFVRATLVDNTVPSGTQPAFDIRYADAASGPVCIEIGVTLTATASTVSYSFSANQQGLSNEGPNLPPEGKNRLDAMAAIYFRTRQYVDWVKARLTSAIPMVSVYTFASVQPDGQPFTYPDGRSKGAAYFATEFVAPYLGPEALPEILIDVSDSAYLNRSYGGGEAPENDEWHEFTHHLFQAFINDRFASGTPCLGPLTNHLGYNNPDTCDSFDEGFAEFLPTLAGRDILGTLGHVISGNVILGSDSAYDSVGDLRWPYQAWDYRDGQDSDEELAVAALFWDLVARNGNAETTQVIGADGKSHPVTYTNVGQNISIAQLWAQLTGSKPATITDVRKSFGNSPLTVDLDGDGVADVAQIDIPFLMHGFYPIDSDQTLSPSHTVNSYDVGYAQRNGGGTRNAFVGQTAHHVYDATGAEIGPPLISKLLVPTRSNLPPIPNSNIGLTVLDASGAFLFGATVNLTMNYPGGQTISSQPLDTGSGDLVHLELLPYFNYLLPYGASLPACDPTHDLIMTVTLSVTAQGQNSTTSPSFDNCTYLHAVAAATGPAALSFTVTVPVISAGGDSTPPITTAALSPVPNGAGWNNTNVTATLTATDNTGGSGVNQITYSASGAQTIATTSAPGATATVGLSTEGLTTVTFFATDNAGNSEAPNQAVVSIDKTAPAGRCGSADGQWHATDVSIACTASDGLSGLSNPSDSSFLLTTAVPAGTETANASTGSHTVCDVAGNCTTAGPIGGNMVDEKPPTIVVTAPASGAYGLNQAVAANYNCGDGGSGVANCAGPVASGAAINTASVGNYTFTVNSADSVGNISAPQVISYSVTYNVCILYDPTRSVQSGATIPLKLDLCNADNADVSSPSVMVRATSLTQLSSNASLVIQDSGNANPDNDFRYDSTLGLTGGYIFNLSTKGLATGSYALSFTAGTDPATHTIIFQVR